MGSKKGHDDIEELKRKFEKSEQVFIAEVRTEIQQINAKIQEFNGHINLINSIRHDIGPQLKHLYQFLSQLGNTSTLPSPFDFKIEIPLGSLSESYDELFKRAKQYQEELSSSSQNNGVLEYIFKGPIWAGIEDLLNNNKNKELRLEGEKNLGNLEMDRESELERLKLHKKAVEEAIRIAEIYRVCVYSVLESIKGTIFPELQGVRSFLMAESVKNSIIATGEIQHVEPESIALMANTLYHKHYLFVQNALLYYTMLSEFFKSPILTDFLEDNIITEKGKSVFTHQVQAIEEQGKSLKNYASF